MQSVQTMNRDQVVQALCVAYFQSELDAPQLTDTSHVVFPVRHVTVETIALNKVTALRHVAVVWHGLTHVYHDLPAFKDSIEEAGAVYDLKFPYTDLRTGKIMLAETVSDFHRFSNDVVDAVDRNNQLFTPAAPRSSNELAKWDLLGEIQKEAPAQYTYRDANIGRFGFNRLDFQGGPYRDAGTIARQLNAPQANMREIIKSLLDVMGVEFEGETIGGDNNVHLSKPEQLRAVPDKIYQYVRQHLNLNMGQISEADLTANIVKFVDRLYGYQFPISVELVRGMKQNRVSLAVVVTTSESVSATELNLLGFKKSETLMAGGDERFIVKFLEQLDATTEPRLLVLPNPMIPADDEESFVSIFDTISQFVENVVMAKDTEGLELTRVVANIQQVRGMDLPLSSTELEDFFRLLRDKSFKAMVEKLVQKLTGGRRFTEAQIDHGARLTQLHQSFIGRDVINMLYAKELQMALEQGPTPEFSARLHEFIPTKMSWTPWTSLNLADAGLSILHRVDVWPWFMDVMSFSFFGTTTDESIPTDVMEMLKSIYKGEISEMLFATSTNELVHNLETFQEAVERGERITKPDILHRMYTRMAVKFVVVALLLVLIHHKYVLVGRLSQDVSKLLTLIVFFLYYEQVAVIGAGYYSPQFLSILIRHVQNWIVSSNDARIKKRLQSNKRALRAVEREIRDETDAGKLRDLEGTRDDIQAEIDDIHEARAQAAARQLQFKQSKLRAIEREIKDAKDPGELRALEGLMDDIRAEIESVYEAHGTPTPSATPTAVPNPPQLVVLAPSPPQDQTQPQLLLEAPPVSDAVRVVLNSPVTGAPQTENSTADGGTSTIAETVLNARTGDVEATAQRRYPSRARTQTTGAGKRKKDQSTGIGSKRGKRSSSLSLVLNHKFH